MDQNSNGTALEWITCGRLGNDPRYQRQPTPAHVKYLAKHFDPDLLGSIEVSERPDGRLVVIDGQHRVAALHDIGYADQKVPCKVHRGLTLEEEAHIFIQLQTGRRQLKPVEVFKAQLMVGEEAAIGIKRLVEEAGFVLNLTSGGHLEQGHMNCVAALRHIWTRYGNGPDLLREVLALLRDAWGVGQGAKGSTILGLSQFVNAYRAQYDRRRLVHVLQTMLQDRLLALGTEQRRVNGSTQQAGVMRALMVEYNKKLSTNRLPEWEDVKTERGYAGVGGGRSPVPRPA